MADAFVEDAELIDRIHECAVLADLWPGVLDDFAHIAGARGGLLFSGNGTPEGLVWTSSSSMQDDCRPATSSSCRSSVSACAAPSNLPPWRASTPCVRNRAVSRETVRTHVRHVLAKTGCRRQGEVALLLGGIAPPSVKGQGPE